VQKKETIEVSQVEKSNARIVQPVSLVARSATQKYSSAIPGGLTSAAGRAKNTFANMVNAAAGTKGGARL